MKRRSFIRKTSFAGLGLALAPLIPEMMKKHRIGVQLWSVRDVMIPAPEKTLESIAAMGYAMIEHAGYKEGKFYGKTPSEFNKLLKSFGLTMPSGHTMIPTEAFNKSSNSFSDDIKKAVDDAATAGMKYLIQPWLEEKWRGSASSINQVTDVLNKAGELCKSKGLTFGYHNHDFEFKKIDESYIYEIMLKNTDPDLVVFEMDLYWLNYAHQDPVEWYRRYPGRFPLAHVKDLAGDSPARETIEVGEGEIDFNRIFAESKTAGLKYYIVELEHYRTNSMDGIALAYKNLNKIFKG